MAEFPYTPRLAGLPRFLEHIQKAGVPGKVTQTYLKSVGFKSGNDTYLLSVLKFIGFLDASGAPTEAWREYRDKGASRTVMAAAVKAAYSDLFAVYPDAYRKDDEALLNYFSSHTSLAKATLGRVVATFKALCAHGDFEAAGEAGVVTAVGPAEAPLGDGAKPGPAASMPSVAITIQLQLPPTDDPSVYDNLFAAMKKHLFQ
jgi:hypothetical protein